MSGKCLLDTNIIIALFAEDNAVLAKLSEAREVFIPIIVLGELYYGACKSASKRNNISLIDGFASKNVVLSCDIETARHYGEIKDIQRANGRPLPENDLWIAAIAKQHHLRLVSRDRHFHEIKGLTVEVW